MKFTPHAYQQYAVDFIEEHPEAALLLDMGLGKTVITLTAVQRLMHDSFEVSRVLVIAPLRVARDTWPVELEKWDHLRDLTFSVAVGTAEERTAALRADTDICIINRENVCWMAEESGVPFRFDMVVIDELSSFKNPQAKRFKALAKLRPKVKRIVGLTGTPSPNGLTDLWAEFRLLDQGQRLGRSLTRYRVQYFKPARFNGNIVYSYAPLDGAEEAIYQRISDITISMNAADYLEMPELISSSCEVQLSDSEMKVYRELQKTFVLETLEGEVTAANAASLIGKLSQLANGAVYTDDHGVMPVHDRKLDALEDIIESMNGRPVLVAYWFKHDLQRIRERLKKLKISCQQINTADSIRDWNAGKIPVGLIHPASAGHGLNLQQGGSALVWYGLTWSLELYQQTNARLYRQGQTSRTVVIQHIIAKGTVDEQILSALKKKDTSQAALISAVKAEVSAQERS